MQLAQASRVTLNIKTKQLPLFPLTMLFLEKNFLTKAHRTNADYTASSISADGLSILFKLLIHDPQTSGGLLLAVDPKSSAKIVETLKNRFKSVSIIGQVEDFDQKAVIFE